MSYQSEAKLEEKLMSQLVDMGYQKIIIKIKKDEFLYTNYIIKSNKIKESYEF